MYQFNYKWLLMSLWISIMGFMAPITQADDCRVVGYIETNSSLFSFKQVKKLGEPLEVTFKMKFLGENCDNSEFDIYIALQMPPQEDKPNELLYLQPSGEFSDNMMAYLTNLYAQNRKVTIFSGILPQNIESVGQYTFYAGVVPANTPVDKVLEVLGNPHEKGNLSFKPVFLTRVD
jgi:hypothetical protein